MPIDPNSRLTKHFTMKEFLSGHPASYLDNKSWKPELILRSLIVLEIARDLWLQKTGRTGIIISSGLRTVASKSAPKTRHMDGTALDSKPAGGFKSDDDYDLYYGTILQSQKCVSDCTYGIGYYKSSKSGIHIDADTPSNGLRASQNRRDGLSEHGIRGWRWMQAGGYKWVPSVLLPLYNEYEKKFVPNSIKTWKEWYEIFKP